MAVAKILTAASICGALTAAICAWRLISQRLAPRYPAFCLYLLSQAAFLSISGLVGVRSSLYTKLFIIAYPITWGVYCFMVRELYTQIFTEYPGIAMFGRWSVYLGLLLATAMGLASRAATKGLLSQRSSILVPLEVAGGDVVFALAVTLIVLLLLVSRYPLELHRNVLLNLLMFSALLLTEAAHRLAEHLTNLRQTVPLDLALMVFDMICFGIWGFLLTPQGETRLVHFRHSFSVEDERRLLAQLNSLNALGARVAGK